MLPVAANTRYLPWPANDRCQPGWAVPHPAGRLIKARAREDRDPVRIPFQG